MDAVGILLNKIVQTLPRSRNELRKLKTRVASTAHMPFIRNDALLMRYRSEVESGERTPSEALERILTINGIRSQSGIATVTVITEPFACPGRCVYCPTEARAPKSYLTNEPAVMRALRSDYDPYGQVWMRLLALNETGHATDKVELIIKGGTWSFYPENYQHNFIQRCIEAANDFGAFDKPQRASDKSLAEVMRLNETAGHRIIGITIETRPDYVDAVEIRRLRELGVTRVELGVQSLEEPVLDLIVRDHGTESVRQATRWLKDAGIKVAYHLMPNLPGATPETDLESAKQLFSDSDYQPDTMKLYPCVVVKTAELYQWWKDGRYAPYDDETLIELLIAIKQAVPPYVRIERVIRDIPSTSIEAGCHTTNLREEVQKRMLSRGLCCRCIRCRQVRDEANGNYKLTRRDYEASQGKEVFLSFEDPLADQLASLLRLRLPSQDAPVFSCLKGAALIRELHTYGRHVPVHERQEGAAQHRGFGWQLIQEAERITKQEFRLNQIAVIAGVGVRQYYQKLGFTLEDTYMIKTLS